MKYYELAYLISPDLSEEESKSLFLKVGGFVSEGQGVLGKITGPFKRKLGYLIKNKKEALLASLEFHLNPESLSVLEKKLKAENQILRYLIIAKKVYKITPREERVHLFKKTPKISEKTAGHKPEHRKVELKEIDQKIEEILGE
jgi:small subunit ribosomal protein S6